MRSGFGCCGCVVGRQNCAGRDLLRSFEKSVGKIRLEGCEGERRYRTLISLLGLLATMRRVVNYHSSWARQQQVELLDASVIRHDRILLVKTIGKSPITVAAGHGGGAAAHGGVGGGVR
ncbi:hypothetical protein F511_14778 [Dorcoceras hygrometricum]|uniref:Uncharacterized protein n=1 Tax=Dorcoceras hygrometricum TaxID=472368 RepID=A0A2Z7C8V3_9LAMI|nr:hypothetical protein F511_14778 [Dorcoceras hygrometricum]